MILRWTTYSISFFAARMLSYIKYCILYGIYGYCCCWYCCWFGFITFSVFIFFALCIVRFSFYLGRLCRNKEAKRRERLQRTHTHTHTYTEHDKSNETVIVSLFFDECKIVWKHFPSTNFAMNVFASNWSAYTVQPKTNSEMKRINDRQQEKEGKKENRFSLRIVSLLLLFASWYCFQCQLFARIRLLFANTHKRIQSDEKRAQYLCKCDSFFLLVQIFVFSYFRCLSLYSILHTETMKKIKKERNKQTKRQTTLLLYHSRFSWNCARDQSRCYL